ncbi:hypothetical protein VKT23_019479 [Stygiomarasmius scandens]|uniref:Heterokaryon incompatibility domain-containing protein n=1 Tax=Marasmiellus scandens TaxID=2682957 RepID=A0ABR1IPC0_9AGAR
MGSHVEPSSGKTQTGEQIISWVRLLKYTGVSPYNNLKDSEQEDNVDTDSNTDNSREDSGQESDAMEMSIKSRPFVTSLQSQADISLTVAQVSPNLPPRPEFTPFTVPYLCVSKPYDGKNFWTYPEHCGWVVHAKDTHCHILCPPGICYHGLYGPEIRDIAQDRRLRPPRAMLSRSDGKPVLASDKVVFLQAWLFFGLLTEVSNLCGLQIDLGAEFVVDDGLLSTAKLNGLPGRWYRAAIQTHRAGDKKLMELILSIARHSRLMLFEELIEANTRMFEYTYAECRVLHSLDILIRITGLHLLLHMYTPGFTSMPEEGWDMYRVEKSLEYSEGVPELEGMHQLSNFAQDDLEEQGWCPSELSLLPSDEMVFASLLARPRIRDHSICGDIICSAYQTDEETYQTRHMEDECNCDFVKVETNALVAALSEDRIPKLVITDSIEVQVSSEHDYPYIALSHVWADGLGNAKSNALPKCQLRRLRDYANHLSRVNDPTRSSSLPVALWIDTLCVPVDPCAIAYRKKAILLLRRTFHEATAVLILDRELEIVKSANASFLELGLRILCSGWIKRLWTLQEASLAGEARGAVKLYFQMQDGPLMYQKYDRDRKALWSLDQHTTEIQAEERSLLLEDGIMLELGSQIPSVRAMRSIREGQSPFQVIYSALEHRSTSKLEDIPLCIASLLGKDPAIIISASDAEQGMANFYLLMREIPIGVLWYTRPERLTIAPFRWALKSITDCPRNAYARWRQGICDLAGLHIETGGFIFTERDMDTNVLLPQVFNIASAKTGTVFCQLRRLSRGKKQIFLQQNLALVSRPPDGFGGNNPDVLIVAVEATTESSDDRKTEFVCKIVDYLYASLPELDVDTLFHGYITADNQGWCIT